MRFFLLLAIVVFFGMFLGSLPADRSNAQVIIKGTSLDDFRAASFESLIAKAEQSGRKRVIVGLNAAFVPDGSLSADAVAAQRRGIADAQEELLRRTGTITVETVKRFEHIPYIALEADTTALRKMQNDPLVVSVQEDEIAEGALAESIPVVSADAAWASGFTGNGQTVAIIDSGVDKNHSFLAGRVVSEACYSSNVAGSSVSVCPGGATQSTATDSGLHCPTSVNGCAHGTNVAGIAAGRGAGFSGVAKDANIVAIQIFSRFDSAANCGSTVPCARYWTSDLIRGLERARTLKNIIPSLAAVNLSLQTGQQFAYHCDASHAATKAAIDNLRSVGVATVACSGNYAFTSALTAPACISTAISVGATDDGSLGTTLNAVSSFSDSSPRLHLLAPGRWINSSIPDNQFANYSGTSMAAPHVLGAYAVLRQRLPNASVGQIAKALTVTGQPITDSRNGIVKPRINVNAALSAVRRTPFDYDDDGRADISVFRPSSGVWYVQNSMNDSFAVNPFGLSTDKIAPADFDGDGKTDLAVYRPESGYWFVLKSSDGTVLWNAFGVSSDTPLPQDYDGDGKDDIAVHRFGSGNFASWWILRSSDGQVEIRGLGFFGDLPVQGDFDGDGKADAAYFRPSSGQWVRRNTSTQTPTVVQFGLSGDRPVPADYDGDGRTDIAVYRPSSGVWYKLLSSNGSIAIEAFGTSEDKPVAADYDGDGKADVAVFRPSNGVWYANRTTGGPFAQQFGITEDRPTPDSFVP